MGESLILAMDGSTNVCSAALLAVEQGANVGLSGAADTFGGDLAGWRIVSERTEIEERGQARVLLHLVHDMLRERSCAPADIAAVVVGVGPGTFTGVRIAVATARALALALSIPVLGVSTLSCLAARVAVECAAAQSGTDPVLIVPVVDARRGQVFYGFYWSSRERRAQAHGVGAGPLFRRCEPFGVCDAGALGRLVRSRVPHGSRAIIVGDSHRSPDEGTVTMTFQLASVRAENLMVGQDWLEEPGEGVEGRRLRAWLVRALTAPTSRAGGRYQVGEPGSPETVKPIYVRSPDADVHITKMKDPWADAGAGRRD